MKQPSLSSEHQRTLSNNVEFGSWYNTPSKQSEISLINKPKEELKQTEKAL